MTYNSPTNSPTDKPQTADKAHVGTLVVSATTIVLYFLARWTGIVEMPNTTLVQDAVVAVVAAAINGAFTWISVYMTRNSRKV